VLIAIAAVWWTASTEGSPTPAVALQVQRQPSSTRTVQTVQSIPVAPSAQPLPRVESAAVAREIPVPPPLPDPVAKPVPAVAAKPASTVVVMRDVQSKPVVAAVTPGSAPAPAPEKIMMMAELSPALQRELPPLAIGGSMYSDKASERMLLIDKRLLHEGEEVAPNLVLEKLMPKEAILRFRGTRFRIAF
jgi:general secretion pathway protein B